MLRLLLATLLTTLHRHFSRPGSLSVGLALLLLPNMAMAGPPNDGGTWNVVFSDDFSSPAFDAGRWTVCYWWNNHGCTNKGNHELQWYLPDGVSVDRGNLVLTASKRPSKDRQHNLYAFSSGMVTTGHDGDPGAAPDRFSFTYGYVEVRAKIPKGKGLWPAIWLLPSSHESLPEIDIAEVLGDTPGTWRVHYHYAQKGTSQSVGQDIEVPDLSLDWHVYGLDWEKDAIVWYIDGVERWRYTDSSKISRQPMYLVMNLAVGGDWPGPPDSSTTFPASMLIDYVRVWSKPAP